MTSIVDQESAWSKISETLISLAAWVGVYKLLQSLDRTRSAEWHCRQLTTIHALIITVLSAYSQFVEGPSIVFIEPALPNTATQVVIVKICLGYFIFDLSWCLYHQTEPPVMVIHHAMSIFGMLNVLAFNVWGCELVGVILATELTNPMLQTRWFLREMGNHKTWYGELVDALFILLFGFFRIVLGGIVCYCYMTHPKPDFMGRLGAVGMYGISWVFWFYIMRYAQRKYSKLLKKSCNSVNATNGHTMNNNGHVHSKHD